LLASSIPGDPGAMQPAEWQKALEATDADFNHLIDGRAMSQFQNVETPGGSVSFVDPNGRLDWEVVNQHRDEFNRILDSGSLEYLNNWDDGNHGYESGLHDTSIDPQALPDPGDSSKNAPRK
jgi:hypothetical protein